MSRTLNSFTVDVEDWFQVSALSPYIERASWDSRELRVERNVSHILGILDDVGVRATCFVLGWVAERVPGIVRQIHAAGHEVASHGYDHTLVRDQTPDEFRIDLRRSIELLSGITGESVIGYRAASFSLPSDDPQWAYDVMSEQGILYDSSIYPIQRGFYGHPAAPWVPYDVQTPSGTVREFPMPVASVGGRALPFGGGGYFRIYPYALTRYLMKRVTRASRPVVSYIHPWEVDPEQPRVDVNMKTRIRHYMNLNKVSKRLGRFLREFDFIPLKERLEHE